MTPKHWLIFVLCAAFVLTFYYFASDRTHWPELVETVQSWIPSGEPSFESSDDSSTW